MSCFFILRLHLFTNIDQHKIILVLSVDVLSRTIDPNTGILTTERLLTCKQSVPSFLRSLGFPIPEVAYFHEVSTLDPRTKEYKAQSINLSMRSVMEVKETCVYREVVVPKGFGMAAAAVACSANEEDRDCDAFSDQEELNTSGPSLLSSLWLWAANNNNTNNDNNNINSTLSLPPTPTSSQLQSDATTTIPTSPVTEFIQTAEFSSNLSISAFAGMMEEAAVSRFSANAGAGRRAMETVINKVLDEMRRMEN